MIMNSIKFKIILKILNFFKNLPLLLNDYNFLLNLSFLHQLPKKLIQLRYYDKIILLYFHFYFTCSVNFDITVNKSKAYRQNHTN